MDKHHDEDSEAEKDLDEEKTAAEENESEDQAEKDTEEKDEPKEEHKDHAEHTGGSLFSRIWAWKMSHKKLIIPLGIVVLLALLAVVPFTRYAIAGTFLKQNLEVTVVDQQTNKPVSNAAVSFGGVTKATDGQGKAKIHVKVGSGDLMVTKQYYKPTKQGVTVPITKAATASVKLDATGRVVPVAVVNKISGKGVAGVSIVAEKSKVLTDKEGKATIILPPNATVVKGVLSSDGYNKADITIKVTGNEDPANTFGITPEGKLYFLSNANGNIDVVKANLDGTARQVVLAGTGKEDKPSTVLLASRDWKYVALLSKRDGGAHAKLFLIDTSSDKLTTMDEGEADFSPLGWSGSRFIYKVTRTNVLYNHPKREAVKSYDAVAKKITLLDELAGQWNSDYDYLVENYDTIYVQDKDVLFSKYWNYGYSNKVQAAEKQATLNTIKSDGTGKKVVKAYAFIENSNFIQVRPADFGELYILYTIASDKQAVDEYKDGKVTTTTLTSDEYYNKQYPNYIVSPTNNKTLFTDFRDGKSVFFIGDVHGENGKQIGASEDYTSYGWFTDDYVLVTKKGSEMHIMPVEGLKGGVETSLKVSDYYKPNYNISGYGYGYGG